MPRYPAFLAITLLACGPPPAARTGPPPPRFHDAARGVASFDPPAPPFLLSETHAANSIVHYADPLTRAGIHLLSFASAGATDPSGARTRADAYLHGLEESVAGLSVVAVRPLDRFGLHGFEVEYDGGATPRMRSIDWILYAPGLVYVVKVTAPSANFAAAAVPLARARDSLRIEPR